MERPYGPGGGEGERDGQIGVPDAGSKGGKLKPKLSGITAGSRETRVVAWVVVQVDLGGDELLDGVDGGEVPLVDQPRTLSCLGASGSDILSRSRSQPAPVLEAHK